jgi:nicotinate-nucleotide adenylyltransferase
LRRDLEREVARQVSAGRYEHCRRVADTAWELSLRYDASSYKAYFAGIGHDMAREWSPERLLERAQRDGAELSVREQQQPVLLHGRAAAVELQERFGIEDREIIEAVRHHTLGAAGLSRLAQVLFVADYVEPGRPYVDADLQEAVDGAGTLPELICIVVDHARNMGKTIAPATAEMYQEAQEHITA